MNDRIDATHAHPRRPLHHRRFPRQAPRADRARGVHLFLQHRRGADGAHASARTASRTISAASASSTRSKTELPEVAAADHADALVGADHHDRRLRPRPRGHAAAGRGRRRRAGQRRQADPADLPAADARRRPTSSPSRWSSRRPATSSAISSASTSRRARASRPPFRATSSAARPAPPKRSKTAAIPPTSGSIPSSPPFPMDDPQYVVLVVLDEPKPEKQGAAATAAVERRADGRRGYPPRRGAARRQAAHGRTRSRPSRVELKSLGCERLAMNRTTETHEAMLLGDLATADLTFRPAPRRSTIAGPRRRQPRRRARLPVRRASGLDHRRRALRRRCGRPRRGRPSSPATTPMLDAGTGVAVHPRRRSAPRARADRGALPSAPAGAAGRRHRHQRQDLGRRVRPPDLRRAPATRRRASARSASSAAAGRDLRQPDDARPDRAARRRSTGSRGEGVTARGARGLEPRARPAPARRHPHRGRRLHQSRPRPHGLPPDASRTISPPSSASSRRSCRADGTAVVDMDGAAPAHVVAAAARARPDG